MSYRIDAWLDLGDPRLRIVDADSGTVRLDWSGPGVAGGHGAPGAPCPDDHLCPGCTALHRLVHNLFLLACIDGVACPRDAHDPQRGKGE